jgi:ATP-dependent helicase/DNAse subunit B
LAKEIWLGPLLGENRSLLIERCAELVSENKPHAFLYIAASHPLLEIVTQGILDGDQNRGVWGELPVYLFRGFVRRLLSNAVDERGRILAPRVPIDQEELPLKRSLVSQILARLMAAGQLKAIAPLANREGCVNTIATLIGEIQRAAKSPAELQAIIAERGKDLEPDSDKDSTRNLGGPTVSQRRSASGLQSRQIDFDREVGLIYSTYGKLLDRHQLTEADADQLRALAVLSSELEDGIFSVPFLADVQLLVLDGFFDFTPVQGEILRRLIPGIPEVIVNLNHDQRNGDIFLPFQDTIERLMGIAPFEQKWSGHTAVATRGALTGLREHLFNPVLSEKSQFAGAVDEDVAGADQHRNTSSQSEIRYLECGDRETEIRAVAKEIKRLILSEGYQLTDLALVVRQRASYANDHSRDARRIGAVQSGAAR